MDSPHKMRVKSGEREYLLATHTSFVSLLFFLVIKSTILELWIKKGFGVLMHCFTNTEIKYLVWFMLFTDALFNDKNKMFEKNIVHHRDIS